MILILIWRIGMCDKLKPNECTIVFKCNCQLTYDDDDRFCERPIH